MKHARVVLRRRRRTTPPSATASCCWTTAGSLPFDAVTWLPPLAPTPQPRTILALGLNYADHAKELEFKAPEEPLVFLKGENALTGHRQFTRRPAGVQFMHYECELTVVIGNDGEEREARRRLRLHRRLHRGQRLRDPRLPGELVPAQPAREEPRRRHAAGALAGRRRATCRTRWRWPCRPR